MGDLNSPNSLVSIHFDRKDLELPAMVVRFGASRSGGQFRVRFGYGQNVKLPEADCHLLHRQGRYTIIEFPDGDNVPDPGALVEVFGQFIHEIFECKKQLPAACIGYDK